MNPDELNKSLNNYNEQLCMINEALKSREDSTERESLISLQNDLNQLVQLTRESLETISKVETSHSREPVPSSSTNGDSQELDDEYALFMQEMADTGAYEANDTEAASCSKNAEDGNADNNSDIEDELESLLGMKCAVYHTHRWGGQPTLHNAMVSSVVPRQNDDQFNDLQVRVLFTHPTHAEMLPCPYFLNGDCKFDDAQCRYSHGAIVQLSSLKEAIEPNFDGIKVGSRVLLKLKPPDDEDVTLTKKSTEKYHLWHRAVVKGVDIEKRVCVVKYEHGLKSGDKRRNGSDDIHISFTEIFPLNNDEADDSDSDDSLSDIEYPESKTRRSEDVEAGSGELLVESSVQNCGPAMGEWERHTRGMGSKLMLAMGYVPGSGLGAGGAGRVAPVEAAPAAAPRSLDLCLQASEKAAMQDPLKVQQKLNRLQKKEEERNKRAYEREKERERRNVFNFLNKTLGDNRNEEAEALATDFKQSTSKDLNIEQFKIMEEVKKVEKEIVRLNGSLARQPAGAPAHTALSLQLAEKNKELSALRGKEQQISREQRHRKDKQKMSVF